MMIKTLIVNTKLASLEVYRQETKEAIGCKWNSLYFSENRLEFLSLLIGDLLFTLTTMGDTCIKDEDGFIYRNDNEEEIRYLIKDDKLDQCIVGEANWFTIIVDRVVKEKSGVLDTIYYDNFKYSGTPRNIEELQDDIIEVAKKYIEKEALSAS